MSCSADSALEGGFCRGRCLLAGKGTLIAAGWAAPISNQQRGPSGGRVREGSERRRAAASKNLEPDEYRFRLELYSPRALYALLDCLFELDDIAGLRLSGIDKSERVFVRDCGVA